MFAIAGLLILLICLGLGFWSQRSGFRVLGRHAKPVVSIAFSQDGSTLFSGSRDAKNAGLAGKAWDVAARREKNHFPGGSKVTLSPDGRLAATLDREAQVIEIWGTETGEKRATLREPPRELWRMAFSPDGKALATAGTPENGRAGDLGLWEAATGNRIREFKIGADEVSGLSFAPGGKVLAASSWDGSVHVWELEGGTELATLPTRERDEGGFPDAVAFSPDGRYLAAPKGASVLVWEVPTRELLATLPTGGYGPALCVAFSPDGRFLGAGCRYALSPRFLQGCLVTFWNVGTWRKQSEVRGRIDPEGDAVYCIAFSPDGSRLAIGTARGYVGLAETDR